MRYWLIIAVMIGLSSAAVAEEKLVASHGIWRAHCLIDPMNDKRRCTISAKIGQKGNAFAGLMILLPSGSISVVGNGGLVSAGVRVDKHRAVYARCLSGICTLDRQDREAVAQQLASGSTITVEGAGSGVGVSQQPLAGYREVSNAAWAWIRGQ